jgi:hypothetical protein
MRRTRHPRSCRHLRVPVMLTVHQAVPPLPHDIVDRGEGDDTGRVDQSGIRGAPSLYLCDGSVNRGLIPHVGTQQPSRGRRSAQVSSIPLTLVNHRNVTERRRL